MLSPQEVLARNSAIETALAEAEALTSNPNANKRDITRAQVLMARVAALKAGFTPTEIAQRELNATEREHGLPITEFTAKESSASPERLADARAWAQFHKTGKVEQRAGQEGTLINQI